RPGRSRGMVQAIGTSRRRGGGLADKVARLAKRVGVVRRLYHAPELGTQPPERAIDLLVVLPLEVLQELLPGLRRTTDERLHLLSDLVLSHGRHTGRRVTQFERC